MSNDAGDDDTRRKRRRVAESGSASVKMERKPPSWYLFPPKGPRSLNIGESIRFKLGAGKYRTGKIVENDQHSQYLFVAEAGETRRIRLDKREQRRALSLGISEPGIVVTSETNHFRQLVGYVFADDQILEIGCSTGETSKLLLQSDCRSFVGVDTSKEMVQRCRNLLLALGGSISKEIHTTVVDALVDPTNAKKEATRFGDPSVVFIDINGNRENINVRRMITWVLQSLRPRLVVVKSREMVSMMKSSGCLIDDATGLVKGGDDWFRQHRQKLALPKHPLQAALMMSPQCPDIPICRYHNYHKDGCTRDNCDLDHDHCHACQQKGHVAKGCALFSSSEGN
mmetsp:Transcript_113453/g.327626  ORF Transcript_113453/g.327626 Transcript_113453/m.327626 type:complete len:341 (-) Transcript_113453:87-1109(-)